MSIGNVCVFQDVTIENVDQYIKLSMEFIFRDGIHRQMEAFRGTINRSFALRIPFLF